MASVKLIGVAPDGTEHVFAIGVGRPERQPNGDWACRTVTYDGREPQPIYGEDSLQALCLGLSFIRSRLEAFLEVGGRLFLAAVSFVLAVISIAMPRAIAVRLMALEFVGFLLFLLLFRGGYAVGFAGQPLWDVLQFDGVSAGCRGGVLALLAFGKDARISRRISMTAAGALCGIAVVAIKLMWFTGPRW